MYTQLGNFNRISIMCVASFLIIPEVSYLSRESFHKAREIEAKKEELEELRKTMDDLEAFKTDEFA